MKIRYPAGVLASLVFGASVLRADDAFEFTVYRTMPGATVEERGDRISAGVRVVPISATFHLDPTATTPEMTGLISNAVLEGGSPFELSVRSVSGVPLPGGSVRFTGDYLPAMDSGYFFDWTFTPSTNGELIWSGSSLWAGGHLWQIDISNLTLVPLPLLKISPVAGNAVEISWSSHFADHVLEQATHLIPTDWSTVTNAVVTRGDQLLIRRERGESSRQYFRLRKP